MTGNNNKVYFLVYLFVLVVIYWKEHNEQTKLCCRIDHDIVDILLQSLYLPSVFPESPELQIAFPTLEEGALLTVWIEITRYALVAFI